MSAARNVIVCLLLHFATLASAIGVMMTMPPRVAVPVASAAACAVVCVGQWGAARVPG
jgi:hypothetical protein